MSSVSYRAHFYSFERSSLIGVIPKWDMIRNSNEIVNRKKSIVSKQIYVEIF
jgi:hypothetical protein